MDLVDNRAAFEPLANVQDDLGGEFGDIGQGGFDGFSVDPFGFTDEPSGVGTTIGDAGYVHGQATVLSVRGMESS